MNKHHINWRVCLSFAVQQLELNDGAIWLEEETKYHTENNFKTTLRTPFFVKSEDYVFNIGSVI